jgi:hypothetical protein
MVELKVGLAWMAFGRFQYVAVEMMRMVVRVTGSLCRKVGGEWRRVVFQ